jgi:hypothetical protein
MDIIIITGMILITEVIGDMILIIIHLITILLFIITAGIHLFLIIFISATGGVTTIMGGTIMDMVTDIIMVIIQVIIPGIIPAILHLTGEDMNRAMNPIIADAGIITADFQGMTTTGLL